MVTVDTYFKIKFSPKYLVYWFSLLHDLTYNNSKRLNWFVLV